MKTDKPEQDTDKALANMILIYLNILWIFGVIWSSWGLTPVLFLALVINHVLSRTEHQIAENRRNHPSPE